MANHLEPRMDAPIETTAMMRANVVRLSLQQIEKLEPELRAQIMDRIGPEVLAAIHDAGALSWIDAELQDEINHVLFDTLSPAAYEGFWLAMSTNATEKGVFGEIAKGAMRLFGVTPHALYRVVARAHRYATRGLGLYEVTINASKDRAELRYIKLPALVRGSEPWRSSMLGTLRGPLLTLGVEGLVELDDSRMHSHHELLYTITWQPKD